MGSVESEIMVNDRINEGHIMKKKAGKKKYLSGLLAVAVLLFGLSGLAQADTFGDWAPNAEPDLAGYNVYACVIVAPATTCTVAKTAAFKQTPSIAKTAAGVRPVWNIPVGKQGMWAVTAFDNAAISNESGLSVALPFDTTVPAIPADLQTH